MDEWAKAAYFDPDRYGAGEAGYWLHPGASNDVLIPGLPEDGGQTLAGVDFTISDGGLVPVGGYNEVQSPWGLWDVSGGVSEWLGTDPQVDTGGFQRGRGSDAYDAFHEIEDRVDQIGYAGGSPLSPGLGLRLAATVPYPASIVAVGAPLSLCASRRLRKRGQN